MKRMIALAALAGLLAACAPRTEGGDAAGGVASQPQTGAASDAVPPGNGGSAAPPTGASPAASPGGGGSASADTTTLVKRLFPEAAQVIPKSLGLDGHSGEDIGSRLGQPLEGHDLESPALVATSAEGRSLGAAWQTDAHVSGGNATVIVGMGLDGRLVGVVVLGSPDERLEGEGFLGQFRGKSAADLDDLSTVKPAPGAPADASREIASSVRRGAMVLKEGLIQPTEHSH